jgi:hypothetical protein
MSVRLPFMRYVTFANSMAVAGRSLIACQSVTDWPLLEANERANLRHLAAKKRTRQWRAPEKTL